MSVSHPERNVTSHNKRKGMEDSNPLAAKCMLKKMVKRNNPELKK